MSLNEYLFDPRGEGIEIDTDTILEILRTTYSRINRIPISEVIIDNNIIKRQEPGSFYLKSFNKIGSLDRELHEKDKSFIVNQFVSKETLSKEDLHKMLKLIISLLFRNVYINEFLIGKEIEIDEQTTAFKTPFLMEVSNDRVVNKFLIDRSKLHRLVKSTTDWKNNILNVVTTMYVFLMTVILIDKSVIFECNNEHKSGKVSGIAQDMENLIITDENNIKHYALWDKVTLK